MSGIGFALPLWFVYDLLLDDITLRPDIAPITKALGLYLAPVIPGCDTQYKVLIAPALVAFHFIDSFPGPEPGTQARNEFLGY